MIHTQNVKVVNSVFERAGARCTSSINGWIE